MVGNRIGDALGNVRNVGTVEAGHGDSSVLEHVYMVLGDHVLRLGS